MHFYLQNIIQVVIEAITTTPKYMQYHLKTIMSICNKYLRVVMLRYKNVTFIHMLL